MPITILNNASKKIKLEKLFCFLNESENFIHLNNIHLSNKISLNQIFISLNSAGMKLLLKKFKKGEKNGVEKEIKERVCVLDVDVYPDIQ